MKILVIDGQGGKLGKQLVERIAACVPECEITAVGTNCAASEAMLKGGAHKVATGENAVVVASRKADVIAGPVGIVIADALLGEISPLMANAIASSSASRVLLPVNKCDNYIAGVKGITISEMIEDAVTRINELINNN